jgi:hypothetical protein
MKPDQNARGDGAAFDRLLTAWLVDSPLSEELMRARIVNGKMGDDAELTKAKVELTRLQKELELLNSAKTPEELAQLKRTWPRPRRRKWRRPRKQRNEPSWNERRRECGSET